jgi:hypothetical protein
MKRLDCHSRIKRAKANYDTAHQAVSVFITLVENDPGILYDNGLELNTLKVMLATLHEVYFAHMFACFETSIRHFWTTTVRNTKPGTEQLPQDDLDTAHDIRDYRNSIIHDDHIPRRLFTIVEALGPLNVFLARLPLEW